MIEPTRVGRIARMASRHPKNMPSRLVRWTLRHPVQARVFGVLRRTVAFEAGNTGVVHKYVQPLVPQRYFRHAPFPVGLLAHVQSDKHSLRTESARGPFPCAFVDIRDINECALIDEGGCDCRTNSPRRARDERGLSRQT